MASNVESKKKSRAAVVNLQAEIKPSANQRDSTVKDRAAQNRAAIKNLRAENGLNALMVANSPTASPATIMRSREPPARQRVTPLLRTKRHKLRVAMRPPL